MNSIRKEWVYLTPAAEEAIAFILQAGITDRDLALTILEHLWEDSSIYSLE